MRAAWLVVLAGCSAPAAAVDAGCPAPADRACAADGDCALLAVQVDCCGSEVARGVASATRAAAEKAELRCAAAWPKCKCLAKDPVADDGKVFGSGTAVKLRCASNRCESFVP